VSQTKDHHGDGKRWRAPHEAMVRVRFFARPGTFDQWRIENFIPSFGQLLGCRAWEKGNQITPIWIKNLTDKLNQTVVFFLCPFRILWSVNWFVACTGWANVMTCMTY
jgi:hypothetical protein